MKILKPVLLLSFAILACKFKTNAQVKQVQAGTANAKPDTLLVKPSAKKAVNGNNYNFTNPTAATKPQSVVIQPGQTVQPNTTVNYKPAANANLAGSIHPTPLESTTFKPVIMTSPGGTQSVLGSNGVIMKKQ